MCLHVQKNMHCCVPFGITKQFYLECNTKCSGKEIDKCNDTNLCKNLKCKNNMSAPSLKS